MPRPTSQKSLTPFGAEMQRLRKQRGESQKQMAEAIGVTPAYLSALEHGHKSRPAWSVLQQIIQHFGLIWDDAENLKELADASNPRVAVDTSKLSVQATRTANLLARYIDKLDDDTLQDIDRLIEKKR
ncbi:MAG: helix-turn-helix domain-containing protein [Alphaproteobacteria bacterium]